MTDISEIVADRSAFFANRVDTYARINNLSHNEAIEALYKVSTIYGSHAVTHTIDRVVPPHLHSSKMPELRKEVENA